MALDDEAAAGRRGSPAGADDLDGAGGELAGHPVL